MPDYPFGKRQRFRDWGMWLADDDDEYITRDNYLVLEDDTPLMARERWQGYSGDLHVRGRQHVDHLNRLRQRLAHGFALARVLNRTVVLPTLWCYCDKFWHRLDRGGHKLFSDYIADLASNARSRSTGSAGTRRPSLNTRRRGRRTG